MDLGEVLKTYLCDNQQGQLVIKFVGESHLCKISIEGGQAIYMTLGSKGPLEALDAIAGKVGEWNNFIKGMPARKRVEIPLNQKLFEVAGAAPLAAGEVPLAEPTLTPSEVAAELAVEEQMIDAAKISAVNERFIDLVGPFASILTEKIYANLAYSAGSPMSSATYTRFISALAAEVPETVRQAFIDAAR